MTDRIHVVHVDDDSGTRALTAEQLERRDDRIDVMSVATAEEALEHLHHEPVDCVLSDYRMPNTDGLEFLSQVRDRWPDLPFILYTARGSEEVASEAISEGATDYVQKVGSPEHFEPLAQRIVAATEQQRASEYERIADLVREVQSDLVRARTREEIETGVCERLVDADPYVFAWIGTVDAATDRVEPQASAGEDAGYLDTIEIIVDDSVTGQGPTGNAVRTHSAQVIQDVSEDPAYDSCREDTLERGYRSSAAIPIEYEGTFYGVLNVYADHPEAFDADEQALLEDLSETIAHAYYRIQVQERYESQYQELFENAPVMMAFTREEDDEPVIADCNQRFAEELGYSRKKLQERPLAELYTAESVHQLLDEGRYDRALEGEFTPQEREFVTANGERLVTLLQATPRRDDDGEIIGTHALYVNITDRMRAQEVLEQAEAMEASMDGMAILDENDEYVYVNQAHADSYGYDDPDRLIGNTWRMLYEDDEIDRFEESVMPVLEETGEWRGEAIGLRADGTTFPQELSLTKLADGSHISVVRDITDQKEREQELQELTREFETVFENVQDALFLLNVDEDETIRFQRFNEREEAFTGKSTVDIRGKTPIEAFGNDLGAELEANYRKCLERQETIVYEEALPIGGDTTVWQTKLTPIVVDGQVERIVGSGREITELRERERELKRKNDLFEQAQEIADLGAWETDLRTEEGWWTEQVNRIYGLSPGYDPEPGEGIEYFQPEDRPTIRKAYELAVEDGEPYDLELRVVNDDGAIKWVRTRGKPIREDGEIVRIRGTIQDITEHKEREWELQRARERLRVLFDEAPDAIAIHDANGEILDTNEQNVDNLGYTRDELLSLNVTDYEVGLDLEEARNYWAEMDVGETLKIEGKHECKDGTTYPVEVWVSKIEVHGEQRFLALGRDISERKEREREVRKLKERLELAVEGAELGVWDLDMTTKEVEYNEQLANILGYSFEEIDPDIETWQEWIHPEDRPDVLARREAYLEGELEGHSTEYRVRTADGEWKWVRDLGDVVARNEDGTPERLVGITFDIDDRKRAEIALEEERDMFADGPVVVFKWKDQGGWPTEYVSENVAEVFGYLPEELESEEIPFADIVHDDDLDGFKAEISAHSDKATERFSHDPYRVVTKDGEVRWVMDHTKNLRKGNEITHRLGYLVDITERKKHEQKLRQFQEAVEQVGIAVYITETDGTIEYVNPAFEEITGYDADEVLGETPSVLQSGEYDDAFYENLWETILSGKRWHNEMVDVRKDGERVVFNQTISPITDDDGNILKFVAVARDITQRKEYERQLEEQRDNLEVLNQVVRHDIRNDLQLVLAYTRMLQTHVEDGSEEYVDQVVQAARNAVDITTTAREVTEVMLQSGVDHHPVPLRSVLENEIDNVRSNHEHVLVGIDGTIPAVDVHANDMLESVFRNLLTNAIQHNDKEVPEVTASATYDDETVLVRIADNGLGISDERKEVIFEQGEMGLDSEGTGLGLYLVDTLVDRYGGDVRVEDNDPEGAVFLVELPIAEEASTNTNH